MGAELAQEDEKAQLFVRYWLGNDKNNAIVQKMNFSKSYKEKGISGKDVQHMQGNPLTYVGADITNDPSEMLQVEAIVVPGSGSPMTYARRLYKAATQSTMTYIPADMKIMAADQSGKLGRWDGILEADDITYKDSEGNLVTQDLGYGFIGTEDHFTTSVPNETDKILVDVEGSIWNRKNTLKSFTVSVDGTDEVYASGDAIPLKVGVNKLTVTCVAAVGKDSTYTIDVTRRTEAKQTTFKIPDGASVLVIQGSKVMKANEDGTYTLENGTYTYHVSMSGYLTKTDNFEVTDEEPNKVIRVMDLEKVPEQSGTVSVQLAGQSTVFCPTRDVEIQQTAEDLAATVMYSTTTEVILSCMHFWMQRKQAERNSSVTVANSFLWTILLPKAMERKQDGYARSTVSSAVIRQIRW